VRLRRLLVTVAGAAVLAGCATAEYTTTEAVRDMQRLGVSSTAARCVVARLHDYYANQYVVAQRRAVERLHEDPAKAAINPQAVDLYVRNKFAGQDTIGNDERARARALASQCRAR
jgi:hypothetical protein